MIKYLKKKILEVVKDYVGKKPDGEIMQSWFGVPFYMTRDEESTGLFERVKELEDKIEYLEDFLKITRFIESKKVGYKAIKTKKTKSK